MYCVRIDPWDSIPATKPYHFVPAEDTYEAVHLATMGFKTEAYMWAPERTKVTDRIRADMKLQDSYMDLRVYMYCPDHNRWAKYRIYPVPQWTTEVAKDDDELKFVVRRKRTTKSRERYTVLPMGEVSEPPLYP